MLAEVGRAGEITLTPAQAFDKAAFLKKARKRRAAMPMTSATVATMRQEERYSLGAAGIATADANLANNAKSMGLAVNRF